VGITAIDLKGAIMTLNELREQRLAYLKGAAAKALMAEIAENFSAVERFSKRLSVWTDTESNYSVIVVDNSDRSGTICFHYGERSN
jgi:hypothetical protein